MKKYELMVIITNKLGAKEAEAQVKESVLDPIKELGGKTTFEDFWGERGFAYKIKNEKWGYYFVTQFEIDGEKLKELRRDLNIDPKVVRFLLITVDEKAPTPRPYAEIKKEADALEKEKKIKAAEATALKEASQKKNEAAQGKQSEKAAPEKKDMVDKKLDQILEDSSLDL